MRPGAGSAASSLPPGVTPDQVNEFGELFTVIGSFEDDEGWTGGAADPTLSRDQNQAWTLTSTDGADSMTTRVFDPPLDLTTFDSGGAASDDGDYIDLWGYQHDLNLAAGSIHLDASPPGQEWTDYFSYLTLGANEVGWRYLHIRKSDFQPNPGGNPSWSNIRRARISIASVPGATSSFTFDLWRMVSADTTFAPIDPRQGVNIRCQPDVLIADAIAKAKELGAEWVRAPFFWHDIESIEGDFDYSDTVLCPGQSYDDLVNEADARGLSVLAVLYGTPEWARKAPAEGCADNDLDGLSDNPSSPPPDPDSIKPFIADMKARYGDRIRYWEIWNEPNSPGFFEGEDASEYVHLLKAAYEEIQGISPGDTVILGGVYDDGEMPISWMDEFYASGGGAYAEVMAFHPYTSQNDPNADVVMSPWNYRGHTRAMRAIMAVYGDTVFNTELWATEFGFTTGGTGPVPELTQGQWYVDAYDIAADRSLIQGFSLYELVNQQPAGAQPRLHEGDFGLLEYSSPGGKLTEKPAFGIVKDRFSR